MTNTPARQSPVTGCTDCPFSHLGHGALDMPSCNAIQYLDRGQDIDRWSRKFLAFGVLGNPIFPPVPPDWCPLRQGPVTIALTPRPAPPA